MNKIIMEQYKKLFKEDFVTASKHLLKWNKNDYVEIFKNPTHSEMKYIYSYSRGIITINGDLYVFSCESRGMHDDILLWAESNNIIKNKPKYWESAVTSLNSFLCVQRFDKTNKWYLGESYMANILEHPSLYSKILPKYAEAFKKTNPSHSLMLETIISEY